MQGPEGRWHDLDSCPLASSHPYRSSRPNARARPDERRFPSYVNLQIAREGPDLLEPGNQVADSYPVREDGDNMIHTCCRGCRNGLETAPINNSGFLSYITSILWATTVTGDRGPIRSEGGPVRSEDRPHCRSHQPVVAVPHSAQPGSQTGSESAKNVLSVSCVWPVPSAFTT